MAHARTQKLQCLEAPQPELRPNTQRRVEDAHERRANEEEVLEVLEHPRALAVLRTRFSLVKSLVSMSDASGI